MIKDRIEQILKEYQLTPAEFADKVDVQRSSISHITSGRNKPSAQFIQNLLTEFREINARWLITGEGTMLNNSNSNKVNQPKQLSLLDTPANKSVEDQVEDQVEEKTIKKQDDNTNNILQNRNKKIDRITILYSDKTFDIYYPND